MFQKGIHYSPKTEFKKGLAPFNKGKKGLMKHTEEWKEKAKERMKGNTQGFKKNHSKPKNGYIFPKGEKHPNWKGGIAPLRNKIRGSIEYHLWSKAVFLRDNFTCQKYGIRGGKLSAHHINNFSSFPELRFAIDNGITFSKKAHDEFHKKYGKNNNTKEQIEEFLSNE
jgi:hypothetical protein